MMKSRTLWFAAMVSALGGFLFGYDWVVIGGAKPFYEAYFGLVSPAQEAWAMSCALVGCLAGAMGSGLLSERTGRRGSLLIAAVVFALSALGTGMAQNFIGFVTWRIAGGVAIGLASALSPIYIAEIAPARIRGKLVCLNELTIVIGILAAQTVNWLIARPVPVGASLAEIQTSWNGQVAWRHMFEAGFFPAMVFLVGLLAIPESPRWLALKGKHQSARSALVRLGGETYATEVEREIEGSFSTESRMDVRIALRQPRMRRVLTVGIVLAVLQQWCGINVIFNYAQEVFSAAGYPLSGIFLNIVITGVTMCVFTFVAIATVERLGRRKLMILGCGTLAVLYAMLGALYLTHQHGLLLMIAVIAAIATYAMTLAPITWVVLSEIFPTEVRGAFMAICTAALWLACFLLTYSFPLLNTALGTAYTFWIYALVCILGMIFVMRRLPETKEHSLESIQALWGAHEQ
ncbi:sugar porter family MFS transporter [Terracidiphilus gabretensis]|uniref:sugar porter family MFS transporter n=1 Tax=Terracidiphilus gabretensis TaxID=1577687 RepID=UPI000A9E0BC6|nr:sugar porter family MFS transporter [Terracidiphilus gabretensis]